MNGSVAVVMTMALIGATLLISLWSRTFNQTTAEFYLAGRTVGYLANASAICGDYFSAASFLGVAAAIYAGGLDGAWFGAGFGAGFVPVVLFFAAPLRRFGEYTLPDFLAARFQSDWVRLAAVAMVQAICLLYLAPQMLAVGQVWEILVGAGLAGLSPYATGVIITTALMLFYVALGGMRGTTWNQVVQFWVLLTAMLLVAGCGLVYTVQYGKALGPVGHEVVAAPAVYRVRDLPVDEARSVMSTAYWEREVAPRLNDPDATVAVLMPVRSHLTGAPLRFAEPGGRYGPLMQISVIITLITGTAGLPHIMNRFYTNPTGPVARITTVFVLGLVAAFYIIAGLVGVLGRTLVPGLAAAGEGGRVVVAAVDGVLANPDALVPFLAQSLGGNFGLGYIAAGAFAAALSTMGGLLIASAASWGHDLYEQYINPRAPEWKKVAVGRGAVVAMALFAMVLGLSLPALSLDHVYPATIALMVTWAFGVAGAGFFPVLLTAIWWKGVTKRGALAGMAVGGFGSVLITMATVWQVTTPSGPDWLRFAGGLTFPAVVTVPSAFAAILIVSYLDRRNLPANLDALWVRIHGTAHERSPGGTYS
ncbi:MAG TPA: cation acetate symporter [Symbiobacteriaceae bacterium]|jgi:cation/acetate symporter|nr:cation acetate symporter [Symbiobacteriaceae bacterium]